MKLLIFLLTYTAVLNLIHCENQHDVIIVGGGAAGIAAATRLAAKGIDLVLLEAQPQLGGRVESVQFGDSKVDLGAQWVHGETGNIVYETMKDTGLLHHQQQHVRFFSSNHANIDEDFSNELLKIFGQIYSATEDSTITNETMGDYFTKAYTELIGKTFSNDDKKLHLAMQALPLMERYICALEAAFNWQQSAAHSDAVSCEGDMFTHWNGKGYYTALEHLMKDFNSTGRVFTNKEVTKIELKQDGVEVRGDGFAYTAKYVIFTPSLGVLKNYHQEIFEPPLPERKVEAIKKMGFDAVHKVWLHFPEAWWPKENFTEYHFIWTPEDLLKLKSQFRKGPHHSNDLFLSNFYGVMATPNNPKVLSAWFTGDFVPQIEKLCNIVLTDAITFTLEKFLGHLYKVQRPDKILRNKWYMDTHFHGTYSHQTVASRQLKPDGIKILAEPIKTADNQDRLLFAGEATNFIHYSTVHGAIETGYREADRVIEALGVNKI